MHVPYERLIRLLALQGVNSSDLLERLGDRIGVGPASSSVRNKIINQEFRTGTTLSVVGASPKKDLELPLPQYIKTYQLDQWSTKSGKLLVDRACALWDIPRARELAAVQCMCGVDYEDAAVRVLDKVPSAAGVGVDAEVMQAFHRVLWDFDGFTRMDGLAYLQSEDMPESYRIAWMQGIEAGMFSMGYTEALCPVVEMYDRVLMHLFITLDKQRYAPDLRPSEYRILFQTMDDAAARVKELKPDMDQDRINQEVHRIQMQDLDEIIDIADINQMNEVAADKDLLERSFQANVLTEAERDKWLDFCKSRRLPVDLTTNLRASLRGQKKEQSA
jgi:hypothetical protein